MYLRAPPSSLNTITYRLMQLLSGLEQVIGVVVIEQAKLEPSPGLDPGWRLEREDT
ncbi:MAG: hypothetical protein MJE68_29695 [Proteobacteria bacterium]|nr:hypothetical protein [Pseudomonadota bacterium]